MIAPLFKRNMISGIKVFFIIFAVICMYTTIIIYMFDRELSDMLNDYQQVLPEMMSAMRQSTIMRLVPEFRFYSF